MIVIEDPDDPATALARIAIDAGGVATSSTRSNRWTVDGHAAHHVIDPATGSPSATDLAAVTVIAPTGWQAEVHATAALLEGSAGAVAHLRARDLTGLAVALDGTLLATGALTATREGIVNGQLWWYLSRASGIIAWLMLTATVLWGIASSVDLFPRRRRVAWLVDLHRWLGGLTVGFVALHLAALVADSYVHFGLDRPVRAIRERLEAVARGARRGGASGV